jgi:hypothetical protein
MRTSAHRMSAEVSMGDRRRPETPETRVVWLIPSDDWRLLGAAVRGRNEAQPPVENRPAAHYERPAPSLSWRDLHR